MNAPAGVEVVPREGWVELHLRRPPVNVLNIELLRQLRARIDEVRADPKWRAVVIRGNGRCFSAGVDVAEHLPPTMRDVLYAFDGVHRALSAVEVPTVAAIHGACLGGGLELALACDLLYAADDATLGVPEIRLAVIPPWAAARFPRLLGPRVAAELVLSGRALNAAEGFARGIVTEAFPAADFSAAVDRRLGELVGTSRSALRLAKQALRSSGGIDPEEGIPTALSLYLHQVMATPDATEGLEAFLQKRAPRWVHDAPSAERRS